LTGISDKTPRVVVGVDDSQAARWALARAAGEARRRGLPLLVVHAIRPPRAGQLMADTPVPSDMAMLQRECATAVRALLSDLPIPPEMEVTVTCPYGHPGQTLTRLATEHDLLVIGHRPRGRLSRMITRSTREYCGRHARATLVTVSTPAMASADARAPESVGSR
jgi:nucleotide-binding universal stress UspA family protein